MLTLSFKEWMYDFMCYMGIDLLEMRAPTSGHSRNMSNNN